jgi:hypothetical protein
LLKKMGYLPYGRPCLNKYRLTESTIYQDDLSG